MPDELLPPILDTRGLRLSPTDISQFIRLEQCERYLRLRLHSRAEGDGFMRQYGAAPQSIPPLLTRSGREFEEAVEARIARRHPVEHLADRSRRAGDRDPDNDHVLATARDLPPGETRVLLQPRLRMELGGWALTGDADLLRLERGADGTLDVLITDIKSTAEAKVEHRLQVAFYHAVVARLLAEKGVAGARVRTAILYRGSESGAEEALSPEETARRETERTAARELFGLEGELLELVEDPDAYLDTVADLVTGPDSLARRVAALPFDEAPFHLTYKCDGCLYNEFCMKWAYQQDDLSLIPHLTAGDKSALRRAGVATTAELARLKEFRGDPAENRPPATDLLPAPGQEALCRRLATTWPVGPRLDELVHRARRYRKSKGDDLQALSYLPSKGYGSLPACDETHNPNLVRVYIDTQHDYLQDRLYLLGALVVGAASGAPGLRRSIVHLTEGPPATAEEERRLFVRWIRDLLRAVVECAAPDAEGEPRAPVHLIFFNSFEQRLLLAGLARHFGEILGAAPALYDFMTQLAAFDSPIATFLDEEIRELKNYPILCQSLPGVANHLRFSWKEPEPFNRLFRERVFDQWRKSDVGAGETGAEWYTGRSRFSSQIPLEYAYAAWGELEPPAPGDTDLYKPYRAATPELIRRFQARRLEALEAITADFQGNAYTEKRPFQLPDLARFTDTARSLARALDEFVTIERHVELHDWKMARHAPPERRALTGETLIGRYVEVDQDPEVAERNRENERRRRLREQHEAEFRAANPHAPKIALTKEQNEETRWDVAGMRVRLRLETEGLDCSLDEALAMLTLEEGKRFVLFPRWTVDERLPPEQRAPFMPTPKQMLYGMRAAFRSLDVERDEAGRAVRGWVEVELSESFARDDRGFLFPTFPKRTLLPDTVYTLDPCPNNIYGFWCAAVTQALCELEEQEQAIPNAAYERVRNPGSGSAAWPEAARAGQERFLAGLDAFRAAGLLHPFEESKREYIGGHGNAPLLLVQGPPGTGKSYSTGFALFARMQGALASGRPFRAIVCCKTHAATDVLLANVLGVREKLRELQSQAPELFAEYFDARLLETPLYRVAGKEESPEGILPLAKKSDREKGTPTLAKRLLGERWCVVGATPGGIYGAVKEHAGKKPLFGHDFCECLVLDEASQMNLPEAVMASLPLAMDGQLIVVGDHRQMPPIVKHAWDHEPRRTFQEYRAYESLFQLLLPLGAPIIRFAESFRLHRDMAEFLRREIYHRDGIEYHSRRGDLLSALPHEDPFVAAVLSPEHPLVVVVHEEAGSQARNPFEQALLLPVLEALSDPERHGLDALEGLGVVVPHRAQRAALQVACPALSLRDERSGRVVRSAVDTVERFQGGERTVILVSATESDREYLLAAGEFLLDPRRLTVALSRAKRKLVLVAARSVFTLFSPDEETFAHSQLWKNLLRRTCGERLWHGTRDGHGVEVWGSGGQQTVGAGREAALNSTTQE